MNLFQRGRYHWTWTEAMRNYELPCAAYKLIDADSPSEAHRELIFEESLLIGLLRPRWNNVTPSPKKGAIPEHLTKIKQIHWSELVGNYDEEFHPAMLTNDGYLVLKEVETVTNSDVTKTKWRKVLYDKEYVKQHVKNIADKIDRFFDSK